MGKSFFVLVLTWLSAALTFPLFAAAEPPRAILWASTIAPIDAGIVGALEDGFEAASGIRVRHVGAGTGAALDLAKKGNIDLVLVHAKKLEEKFVAEGYGLERIPLMYNDFVIVGPDKDPAGVRGSANVTEALKRIKEKEALFITRGDKSGTHVAEAELWARAGIEPRGAWYVKFDKGSEGNVPTLRYTDSRNAYTVIDRATFLSLKKEIGLAILFERDEALLNRMSVIPVNPKKVPGVEYSAAMMFIKWLTAPDKGQKVIRDFGKEKYGSPLFFPDSKEWRESR